MRTPFLWMAAWLACAGASLAARGLPIDAGKSWVKVDAKATGHRFTGTLEKFEAKVSGDDSMLTPTTATLSWNFADLKTGDAKRDTEMLKWLDHGKTPSGTFSFAKSWKDPQGVTWAQGNLKIHGISKSIAFPLTAKKEGKRVRIDGEVWIDYSNFNLPLIRTMAVMTVDPKLRVSFHLEGDLP